MIQYPLKNLRPDHLHILRKVCRTGRDRSIYWDHLEWKVGQNGTLNSREWNMLMTEFYKIMPEEYEFLIPHFKELMFPLNVFGKLGT